MAEPVADRFGIQPGSFAFAFISKVHYLPFLRLVRRQEVWQFLEISSGSFFTMGPMGLEIPHGSCEA